LVKGRKETMRLGDSVNSERITLIVLHEFIVNRIFVVHDSIFHLFATRHFTSLA